MFSGGEACFETLWLFQWFALCLVVDEAWGWEDDLSSASESSSVEGGVRRVRNVEAFCMSWVMNSAGALFIVWHWIQGTNRFRNVLINEAMVCVRESLYVEE